MMRWPCYLPAFPRIVRGGRATLAPMSRSLSAIVHAPSPRMRDALRTHVAHEALDVARVASQHAAYCAMLEGCGVDVRTIDVNGDHPDAVFVEDTALVLDELAVVASMGAPSRANEPRGVEPELRRVRRDVARIAAPATLEGGDVLRVGNKLLVGLSSRTNARGVAQLSEIVRPHGYVVVPVRVSGALHLKTACTALPDGTLLVNPHWIDLGTVLDFELLGVHEDEPFGANVLLAGDVVCTGTSSPGTVAEIRRRGFDVRTTELDELAKAEGSATCLSLLFAT
jgi:dimethylargininase